MVRKTGQKIRRNIVGDKNKLLEKEEGIYYHLSRPKLYKFMEERP